MGKTIYLESVIGYKEDTLSNWQEKNPVLKQGEVSFVRDGEDGCWLKIGDGKTDWNSLPYKMGPIGPKGEKGDKGDGDNWKEIVNVTLTENLATEFRQVFDKPYKKIRFKILFLGSSETTLSNVRFKRAKADGNSVIASHNYLLYSSGGNLATRRILWGTAFFDLDNRISVTDGGITTGYRVFANGGGNTFGGDMTFGTSEQNFPEFYFYLGGSIAEDGTLTGNVIGEGTVIQVWGCE